VEVEPVAGSFPRNSGKTRRSDRREGRHYCPPRVATRVGSGDRERLVSQPELHEDVKRLVREHILSVEQLEILLFPRSRSDREFDVKGISDEIRTSERSAAARLADLEARGFLAARNDAGGTWYRYNPVTGWLRHAVDLLEKAYAERRYTIIDLIFSKPIENLKVYADAFRFRKDDSDG
jgi:hypothetical protein